MNSSIGGHTSIFIGKIKYEILYQYSNDSYDLSLFKRSKSKWIHVGKIQKIGTGAWKILSGIASYDQEDFVYNSRVSAAKVLIRNIMNGGMKN